ncbi:LysR family transcriptional regulator [Nakamurella leprariae]|uniref:LysR family transcriptional regulator n=1 Tax=Nakamurella leprariae TaxID=2803911 RepID=A0A938Y8K3_9ACTN|nr:LysR family transcriptional regulator [Nakamurella leprariae]MBM9468016.1 LysR family transcriptional regulator [Nakamurella leprariae]
MTRADDLVVLLEVARAGSFVGAAAMLGVDHTTVARRISALERDLGRSVVIRGAGGCTVTDLGRDLLDSAERIERALADVGERAGDAGSGRSSNSLTGLVRIAAPEAFGARFVAPVVARLHRRHRGLQVELVTATRPLVQGVGSDIEIGVGLPASPRIETVPLTEYCLGIYASAEYLADRGRPTRTGELAGHSLIYYVDSLLRVDDLQLLRDLFPGGGAEISSTSVHAQLQSALAGGGIAMLPAFLADREPGLQRILPAEVSVVLQFRALLAPRVLRRPAATAVLDAIRREVAARRAELLPELPGPGRESGLPDSSP